jgi:hypothetical protein
MESSIEIKTQSGYQRLLADPKFMVVAWPQVTAEVIDDPMMPAFRSLLFFAGKHADFRIDGREALCAVQLSPAPLLEPKKVAFRRLTLTERQPGA